MKGTKAICQFVKKHSPTILSTLAAFGVAGTAYLAARGREKADSAKMEAIRVKQEPLTKKEEFLVVAPKYIPAVTAGGVTVACIFGANVLNHRQQAALMGAYVLLENSYKDFKKKFNERYGPEAEAEIRHEIAKDKVEEAHQKNELPPPSGGEKLLFFEELSGEYFEATEAEILYAEYHFNRNFVLAGHALLNQLYDWYGLPHTKAGEVLGWNLYDGECFYGYRWVDFEHNRVVLDDGLEVYVISMPFAPHADYEEEG